ncbi:putative TPR protein [Paratrimastix pyriformis]|uniref:TPR protein n=1 Tax=Paratrimastix pyriformis TaxID=342808 RepID=A0ABQ8UNH7_9EUKA|nr:putative TPR protein [Paratrimastix pyriformis]
MQEDAAKLKERANAVFSGGNYDEALSLYTEALNLLAPPVPPPPFSTPIISDNHDVAVVAEATSTISPPPSDTAATSATTTPPPAAIPATATTQAAETPVTPSVVSASPPEEKPAETPAPAVPEPAAAATPEPSPEELARRKQLADLAALLLNNRSACHLRLGHFEECVADTTRVLATAGFERNVKALDRRAQAYQALGKQDQALADYKAVVEAGESDPERRARARNAIPPLEAQVAARHEREKEELLGKLKDLGNTLLGKIGLSLDNFKMQKDPNTGSYSINFQK